MANSTSEVPTMGQAQSFLHGVLWPRTTDLLISLLALIHLGMLTIMGLTAADIFASQNTWNDITCLMALSSGYMLTLLYRHKRQSQHLHSTSLSPKASPEQRATRTILLLLSFFVVMYCLDCIISASRFMHNSDPIRNSIQIIQASFPALEQLAHSTLAHNHICGLSLVDRMSLLDSASTQLSCQSPYIPGPHLITMCCDSASQLSLLGDPSPESNLLGRSADAFSGMSKSQDISLWSLQLKGSVVTPKERLLSECQNQLQSQVGSQGPASF
ncbi:hypothetical protein A6R68_21632 [Neotoma lepida]|uniref:Vomeronasal type-1 receptor n=1 Tax=Neotoma lepida TaxID=56216 RepID=A0A1A6HP01_NEOLE|nr:hypothetical protein A6R68_21632 [Neotoma lepida]